MLQTLCVTLSSTQRKELHVSMSIETITFERAYWVELQEKLCQYYFTHFIKYAAAEFAPPCTDAVVVCHSTTVSQPNI